MSSFTRANFVSHRSSSSTTLRIFFILDFAADNRFACIRRSLFSSSVRGSGASSSVPLGEHPSSATHSSPNASESPPEIDRSLARIALENPVRSGAPPREISPPSSRREISASPRAHADD